MVNNLLRWLRGYVVFTATGKFPERLINLATLSDITIINPVGGKGGFTAQVSVAEYKMLYKIRKRTMTHLHIIKKAGLPFIIYKNKKRKGILAGIILFAVIINVLSMFIWSIDIKGNDQVSTYQMQESLRENGVFVGALKNNINVSRTERDFALQLGKVGWMSVNIIGSTASVELSESYDVPEIIDKTKPCNLKATKSGQVLKMDIREGKNYAVIGDGVAKGQLLVSGIVEIGETGKSRFVHSEGEVYAGVQTQESITIQKKREYKGVEQRVSRRMISIMNLNIPVDFVEANNICGKRLKTDSLFINNTNMPINLITEDNFTNVTSKVSYNKNQAEKLANVNLALNDIFSRWDCDIKSKRIKATENNDSYTFTADYYCIENIAEAVPINIVD